MLPTAVTISRIPEVGSSTFYFFNDLNWEAVERLERLELNLRSRYR